MAGSAECPVAVCSMQPALVGFERQAHHGGGQGGAGPDQRGADGDIHHLEVSSLQRREALGGHDHHRNGGPGAREQAQRGIHGRPVGAGGRQGHQRGKNVYLVAGDVANVEIAASGHLVERREIQSILEGEDNAYRVRLMWAQLNGCCGFNESKDILKVADAMVMTIPGLLATDSKGAYDAVELNEGPLLGLSNIRAALQPYQLCE